MSTTNKMPVFSATIFWLCLLQAVLGLVATFYWCSKLTSQAVDAELGFVVGILPLLGSSIVLFGIIPSAALYRFRHRRWDLISFRISSITLGVLVAEAAFLVWRGH